MFKEVLNIIRTENPQYENNVSLIQDALMKGLEAIKNNI